MKTLSEPIAARGIDETREVRLMNRRARYAMTRDRPKFYASSPAPLAFGRKADGTQYTVHDVNADMQQLRIAGSLGMTRDYVAAWCRLNHLMEC